MPLFDFIQDVGAKFDSERQKQLDAARAAAQKQAAAAAAADAAAKAAAKAEAEAMSREYDALMLQSLEDHVAQLGLGQDTVQIAYAAGIVTLTGSAPDADTKEKLVLAVGNVFGVEQVDDQIVVPDAPEPTFYTVKKGDTLSKISTQFYGVGKLYRLIFEANRPMLKDPDRIYVGQVLRIPEEPE